MVGFLYIISVREANRNRISKICAGIYIVGTIIFLSEIGLQAIHFDVFKDAQKLG